MLSCETAHTLEARSRIIEVLQLNREFKQAVRNSLSISATNAEIDALFATIDADGGECHGLSLHAATVSP